MDDLHPELPQDPEDISEIIELNPFSYFVCKVCTKSFDILDRIIICPMCREIYHLDCIDKTDYASIKNKSFSCKTCKQEKDNNDKIKSKSRKNKRRKKFSSCSSTSISSEDSSCSSIPIQNKKSKKKCIKTYSDSSILSDNDDESISTSKAILNLYKFTRHDRKKSKFESLPIVDCIDTKWSIFFDLFKQSHKLFSDAENVLRIQKSITSKEILDIGGINLFNPLTYFETLKLIDERICHSINLINKETRQIIELSKLNDNCSSKDILNFINKIVNYSNVVEKYGKKKHKIDDKIISHIANVMPDTLNKDWHTHKSKLEKYNKEVSIKDIANYLSKQVSHINSKILSEEIDPWKDDSNNSTQQEDEYSNRSYSHSCSSINSRKSFTNSHSFCWLHKTKNHSSFKCNKLWSINGKEASRLAKVNNICICCGQSGHKQCHKFKCKIEDCNKNHHILFCHNRKGRKMNESSQSSSNSENNNENNKESDNLSNFINSVQRSSHMRGDTMSYNNYMNNMHTASLFHHNHSHNTQHNKSKSQIHLLKDEIIIENPSTLNIEDRTKEVHHLSALPEKYWPRLPNTPSHLIFRSKISLKDFHINYNHNNQSTFQLIIINFIIIWHTFKSLFRFNMKNLVNQFHKICDNIHISYSEAQSSSTYSNENRFPSSNQNIRDLVVEEDNEQL